jgi:microcystin-dependent protein
MEGFLGFIVLFCGGFAPENWAFCDGQILTIASNGPLYKVIGNQYGGNAAAGTFALPKLADAAPGIRFVICVNGDTPASS